MVPSSHKTLLVACFATACLLPWIQSLSIPPTPKVQVFRGTIPSEKELADVTSTTTAVSTEEDANNGRDDDLFDEGKENKDVPAEEQSGRGMRKDSDQERDTTAVSPSSPLELSPNASSSNTEDADQPETTTITDDIEDPRGTDATPVEKLQPVFEVVDIVLRPFRPPAIMVLDFFRKPSSNATGSSSEDDGNEDSKPIPSTSSSSESGSESNENEGSATATASPATRTQDIVIGTSSNENSGEKKDQTHDDDDDALVGVKASNQQQQPISSVRTTPAPSNLKIAPNGDSPNTEGTTQTNGMAVPTGSNKGERKRRETNQMGNNSNMGDDETGKKGKFQHDDDDDSMTTTTSSSTTITSSNVNVDDTPIMADISGDDDRNSADNGENKTDGNKSGTVKIFLEILQLVPLSNSSTSTSSSSSVSPLSSMGVETSPSITSTTSTTTTTTPSPKGESAEADPNQKISPANPSAQTTTLRGAEAEKRVARSVTNSAATAAAAAEEKSNPSSSPTASALPSSGTTRKPLTSEDAPAAPLPST